MIVLVGQIAGMSGAFAMGGALVSMSTAQEWGWRWAMLWLAAPLVPIVLLTIFMREPQRTEQRGSGVTAAPSRSAHVAVAPDLRTDSRRAGDDRDRRVRGARVGAPTLTRNFALGAERVGAIMSTVVLIAGIVGSIAGGVLADACQRNGGPRHGVAGAVRPGPRDDSGRAVSSRRQRLPRAARCCSFF